MLHKLHSLTGVTTVGSLTGTPSVKRNSHNSVNGLFSVLCKTWIVGLWSCGVDDGLA